MRLLLPTQVVSIRLAGIEEEKQAASGKITQLEKEGKAGVSEVALLEKEKQAATYKIPILEKEKEGTAKFQEGATISKRAKQSEGKEIDTSPVLEEEKRAGSRMSGKEKEDAASKKLVQARSARQPVRIMVDFMVKNIQGRHPVFSLTATTQMKKKSRKPIRKLVGESDGSGSEEGEGNEKDDTADGEPPPPPPHQYGDWRVCR